MTKEELEHNHIKEIAENYVNECWGTYLDLGEVDLVLAGIGVAKIISKEKEERIKELEKENAELKEKLGDVQMQKAGEKSDLVWKLKTANEQKSEQLTNAKEIIKDLLSLKSTVSSAEDVKKRFSVRERAEDFLKENET